MQDSTNSNPNAAFPIRSSGHRRAHSEVQFRLPEDMDLVPDELISEDDLFCSYMYIEKLGSRPDEGPSGVKQDNSGHGLGSGGGNGAAVQNAEAGEKANEKPRHRFSNSVDGSSIMESVEAKKAMSPDKLAKLWTIDPKRAKRIIANRQSASRSKERKAQYISELERKVQTLQTEATTLSAQLMLFQRDTTGLSTENTELKIRLQAMEQQAQLRDALNEALKKEVQRLKLATGETMTPTESYNLGMQHSPSTHSSFLTSQSQPGSADSQFNPYHSNPSTPRQPQLNQYHSNPSTPHQPLQLNPYQSNTPTPRQLPQLNPYQSNPSTPRQPPQLNPYQSNPSTPCQPQPNPYHSNPSTRRQPQFNPYQSSLSTPSQPVVASSPSHGFSDMLAQDHLRRMQGLDISSRSSHLVKYKCPSISTSEGCGV